MAKPPEPLFIGCRKVVVPNIGGVADNQIETVIFACRRTRFGEVLEMKRKSGWFPKVPRRCAVVRIEFVPCCGSYPIARKTGQQCVVESARAEGWVENSHRFSAH